MKNNYNIGIYGISGSGKSTLITLLNKESSKLKYFEGSTIMENILNDDISKFKFLNDIQKYKIREEVISIIKNKSVSDKHNIIDGHYSFIKEHCF